MPPVRRSNANGGNNNAAGVAGNNNAAGAAVAAGAPVAMTQQQLTTLLNGILSQINVAGAGRNAARNNAAPTYAVPPERVRNSTTRVMEDSPLGKRFQDGTDVKIAGDEWKKLDQEILGLTNGDVHALRDENIKHPHDNAF